MEKDEFDVHKQWISVLCRRIQGCESEIQEFPLLTLSFFQPINVFQTENKLHDEISINELCTAIPYALILNAVNEISPKSLDAKDIFDEILSNLKNKHEKDVSGLTPEGLIQGVKAQHMKMCQLLEEIVVSKALTVDIITKDLKRLPRSFFILQRRPETLEEACALWLSKYPISETIPLVSSDFESDVLSGQHVAFVLARAFPNDIAKYDVNVGPSLTDIMASQNWELLEPIAEKLNMFLPPRYDMNPSLLYAFIADVFYATRNDVRTFAPPVKPLQVDEPPILEALSNDAAQSTENKLIEPTPRKPIVKQESSPHEANEEEEKEPEKKQKKKQKKLSSSSASSDYESEKPKKHRRRHQNDIQYIPQPASGIPSIKGPLVEIVYKSNNRNMPQKAEKEPPQQIQIPMPQLPTNDFNVEADESMIKFNEEAAKFSQEAQKIAQQLALLRCAQHADNTFRAMNAETTQPVYEYDYEEDEIDENVKTRSVPVVSQFTEPELALCIKEIEKLSDNFDQNDINAMGNALKEFFDLPEKQKDFDHLQELIKDQYPENEDPQHVNEVTKQLMKIISKVSRDNSIPKLMVSAASALFGQNDNNQSRGVQTQRQELSEDTEEEDEGVVIAREIPKEPELKIEKLMSEDIESPKKESKEIQIAETTNADTQTERKFQLSNVNEVFTKTEPVQEEVIQPVEEATIKQVEEVIETPKNESKIDLAALQKTITNFDAVKYAIETVLLPDESFLARKRKIYQSLSKFKGGQVVFLLNTLNKEYKGAYAFTEANEAKKITGKGPAFLASPDIGLFMSLDQSTNSFCTLSRNSHDNVIAITMKRSLEPQCW